MIQTAACSYLFLTDVTNTGQTICYRVILQWLFKGLSVLSNHQYTSKEDEVLVTSTGRRKAWFLRRSVQALKNSGRPPSPYRMRHGGREEGEGSSGGARRSLKERATVLRSGDSFGGSSKGRVAALEGD